MNCSDLGQQWADEQKAAQDDPGAQVDKAEELQAKWNVQPGDLWQLGAHRLICGDCTDAATVARVMGGEKAEMVFTDPPYGIDVDTDYTKNTYDIGRTSHKYSKIIGDDKLYDPSFILGHFDYVKDIVSLGCELLSWNESRFVDLLGKSNLG